MTAFWSMNSAYPGNKGNIFEICLTADFVKIKF